MEKSDMLVLFAALAPQEIPAWFIAPGLPTAPAPLPDWRTWPLDNEDDRAALESWVKDGAWDLEGELRKFQDAFTEAYNNREAHKLLEKQHRFFAWRFAYAEKMVAGMGEIK